LKNNLAIFPRIFILKAQSKHTQNTKTHTMKKRLSLIEKFNEHRQILDVQIEKTFNRLVKTQTESIVKLTDKLKKKKSELKTLFKMYAKNHNTSYKAPSIVKNSKAVKNKVWPSPVSSKILSVLKDATAPMKLKEIQRNLSNVGVNTSTMSIHALLKNIPCSIEKNQKEGYAYSLK